MSNTKGKILVTGGAGFIGSHTVVALVEAGYEPVIVDNFSNSEKLVLDRLSQIIGRAVVCHEVDCTDTEAMTGIFEQEENISGVIHFAAFKQVGESVQFPEKYHHNNVGSLETLIEVMRKKGVDNLVFSSSCTVYGQPEKLPVDETARADRSESPYGKTKVDCEAILLASSQPKNVMLRYFNPIGAHPSGLIGELPKGKPANLVPAITRVLSVEGEQLMINGDTYDTPDGTCIRDYLHVVDLAKAHVLALEWLFNESSTSCEAFNLGMGRGYSVMEIVKIFEEVNGVEIPKAMGPKRSGDIVQIYGDANKAKRILNWETEKTIAEALEDAWRWQQNLNK